MFATMKILNEFVINLCVNFLNIFSLIKISVPGVGGWGEAHLSVNL